MHVRVQARTQIGMYACKHVSMYACMDACMYACMHGCMHACMDGCMYASMSVTVCMYSCIYVCRPYNCTCVFSNSGCPLVAIRITADDRQPFPQKIDQVLKRFQCLCGSVTLSLPSFTVILAHENSTKYIPVISRYQLFFLRGGFRR